MGSGGSGGSGAGRGEGAQGADRVPDPALEVRSDLPVEESLVTAMREALDLGVSACLRKPFQLEELLAEVGRLLDGGAKA